MHQKYILNAAGLRAINEFVTTYSACKIPTELYQIAEMERNTIMTQGYPGLILVDKYISRDGKQHVLSLNPEWFDINTGDE